MFQFTSESANTTKVSKLFKNEGKKICDYIYTVFVPFFFYFAKCHTMFILMQSEDVTIDIHINTRYRPFATT